MEHKNFVTPEEVSAEQNNIKTMFRFISNLTLLRKILIPTLMLIMFAAAAPPYFLWLVGEMLNCMGEPACQVTHDIFGWEMVVPATLSSLVVITLFAMFSRVAAWTAFELAGQWSTQVLALIHI